MSIDRLTAADVSNLRWETPAAPMHIGALLIVEAAPLLDSTGELRLEEIRRRLELRLSRVPALRRKLLRTGPLQGRPIWIDDSSFDITQHVRSVSLRPASDDTELLRTVERLIAAPLARARPLWEMWFLTGVVGGRLGVLFKLHHAVADGLAAVVILSSLFDADAQAPDPAPAPWSSEPPPLPWSLLKDNASRKLASAGGAARVLAHPLHAGATAWALGSEVRRGLRSPAAPRTSINRPVGAGRHVRFARFDLAAIRARAHAAGGKVNDVVLDLVAGGVRELLLERGEPAAGIQLIASVPVALRTSVQAESLGNAVGVATVPLDLDANAGPRLESIVAATRRAKAEQRPAHIQALMAWLATTPVAQAFITRQRLVNLFVTNVPGPPIPIYLLGARVLDVVPIVSPAGNVTTAFCAFSYAGCLYLVATVDASGFPDVDRLMEGATRAWRDLCHADQAQTTRRDAHTGETSARLDRATHAYVGAL